MTPKPTGFRPDPNKWINTSSSSKSRPPVQRPLVALKHGFMTPTPSRLAEPRTNTPSSIVSKAKGKGTEVVRGGDRKDEQATLGRYMTPPRSAKPKRALERIRREVEALTGSCAGVEEVNEGRLKKTEDDWGSDDGPGEEGAIGGPSRSSRPPDVVDLTTQSSPGSPPLSPSTTAKTKEDPAQPIPIPSSNLQSQPLKRKTKRPNHLSTPVVATGLMSSSHKTQSPRSELSDPPAPITPVPLSIMAMHQHLCGQDVKKAKEPVLPKSQLKKRDIDLRVQNGSRGETGDLVQLSSDLPEEDTPGKILSPLRTNTIRSRHLRGTSVGIAQRPKSKVLARYHTSRVGDVPFLMDFAPPLRVVPDVSDTPVHRPSSPTPIRSSPPAPTPTRPTSITPRKRTQHHHQITPPKSRERRQMQDQAETLFALPPPPQPNFAPPPQKMGPSKRQRDWNAVEMNPETLLTWSLGGSAGQQTGIDRPDSVEGTGRAPVEGVLRGSHPRNDPQIQSEARKVSPKSARSNSGSPAQSIGPSEPSQSFPILVQSSQPGSSAPQQPKSLSHPHPPAQVDRWSHLINGILSVPVEEVTPTAKPSKKARKSGSASTPRDGSQVKLAAFGFFPKHTPQTQDEDKVFETSWEDEQDLDLEVEADEEQRGQSTSRAEGRLRPVPYAPHHPGLQPAGIRELERRAAVPLGDPAGSATNKVAILDAATPSAADRDTSPPLFDAMTPRPSSGLSTATTPTTSSSLMDDLPGSMGTWWAGIGERDM